MSEVHKRKGGLRTSFLFMSILPIVVVAIIVVAVSYKRIQNTVYDEVEEEMRTVAMTINNTYDTLYPGEYATLQTDSLMGLMKGNTLLTEEYLSSVSEDTKLNFTIFFHNIRMVTTLTDEKGQSVAGLQMNSAIQRMVIEEDSERFFSNTRIQEKGEEYFAYYMPIHSAGGEVVGALEVLKTAVSVNSAVGQSVMPIIVITLIAMLVAGALSTVYATNVRHAITRILSFLDSVRKGNLKVEMPQTVSGRGDEIGDLAKAASEMQYSLREMVEKDALTRLYNRRYGNNFLKNAWTNMERSGMHYCVCIGDIDFFKKVNDTYGHDAGDLVLQTVASVLKKNMAGRGTVARWGGEEFLFVFEEYSLEQARNLLWSILGEIREIVVSYEDKEIRFTMSYGVVEAEGLSIEEALKKADDCLYYAKEHGRNQVVSDPRESLE